MKLKDTLRYRFDTFMAKGGVSIFTSLVAVFLTIFFILALLRGILLNIFPIEMLQHKLDFWGNIYITFLELTDPGNMAQDIESAPWFKVVAILAGLSGVIMFSALIAFITTALDQKINELKRGHSKVIEKDHTLILGWNEQRIVEIIRELVMANESEADGCVVVLADVDKEQMDDVLRLHLPNTLNTRIVTRSGNTSSLANLEVVSVNTCKSIIILATCDDMAAAQDKSASDAKVIQSILALNNIAEDKKELNIIAEIYNHTHRSIIENNYKESVITIDTSDILAKVLVQTSRSVGLSVVYNELLSFDGCELYFHHDQWNGILFKDLVYRFPDGVPLGIRHHDGKLTLNPDLNYSLKADDDILIVADDDSTIDFKSKAVATPQKLHLADRRNAQRVEKELILGWTNKSYTILEQYADYVKPGSQIDIMLNNPADIVRKEIKKAQESLDGINLTLVEKDRLNREELMSMEPFTYDNIIILAEGGQDVDAQKVDSENIVTLLLLRDIFESHKEESKNTKLITEVLDSQNYPLISQAGVKDVIISNRLISMMLAQVSESRDIKFVYDDIFNEDGSEIYLKSASLYFDNFPVELTFADMIQIAQERGAVCFGVKIKANEQDSDQNFGIKLIPEKDEPFTINRGDSLVVLAEDET
ncbi:MAG: hypothetical protein OEV42_20090 [Deltaproteobacteria bacterium]|nr:hypothetical protein [Deltaproteobacteria bacterium]